jgi:hypothetical protein
MREHQRYRRCPVDGEMVRIIILNYPDNNKGCIVMCDKGNKNSTCPKGRKHVCEFQFTV